MLYISLTCELALSKMFPAMFKPREIPNFIEGKFHCAFNCVISALIPLAFSVSDITSGTNEV